MVYAKGVADQTKKYDLCKWQVVSYSWLYTVIASDHLLCIAYKAKDLASQAKVRTWRQRPRPRQVVLKAKNTSSKTPSIVQAITARSHTAIKCDVTA